MQAVAAQCMLPLVPVIDQVAQQQGVLLDQLWNLLQDADDLSPATGACGR